MDPRSCIRQTLTALVFLGTVFGSAGAHAGDTEEIIQSTLQDIPGGKLPAPGCGQAAPHPSQRYRRDYVNCPTLLMDNERGARGLPDDCGAPRAKGLSTTELEEFLRLRQGVKFVDLDDLQVSRMTCFPGKPPLIRGEQEAVVLRLYRDSTRIAASTATKLEDAAKLDELRGRGFLQGFNCNKLLLKSERVHCQALKACPHPHGRGSLKSAQDYVKRRGLDIYQTVRNTRAKIDQLAISLGAVGAAEYKKPAIEAEISQAKALIGLLESGNPWLKGQAFFDATNGFKAPATAAVVTSALVEQWGANREEKLNEVRTQDHALRCHTEYDPDSNCTKTVDTVLKSLPPFSPYYQSNYQTYVEQVLSKQNATQNGVRDSLQKRFNYVSLSLSRLECIDATRQGDQEIRKIPKEVLKQVGPDVALMLASLVTEGATLGPAVARVFARLGVSALQHAKYVRALMFMGNTATSLYYLAPAFLEKCDGYLQEFTKSAAAQSAQPTGFKDTQGMSLVPTAPACPPQSPFDGKMESLTDHYQDCVTQHLIRAGGVVAPLLAKKLLARASHSAEGNLVRSTEDAAKNPGGALASAHLDPHSLPPRTISREEFLREFAEPAQKRVAQYVKRPGQVPAVTGKKTKFWAELLSPYLKSQNDDPAFGPMLADAGRDLYRSFFLERLYKSNQYLVRGKNLRDYLTRNILEGDYKFVWLEFTDASPELQAALRRLYADASEDFHVLMGQKLSFGVGAKGENLYLGNLRPNARGIEQNVRSHQLLGMGKSPDGASIAARLGKSFQTQTDGAVRVIDFDKDFKRIGRQFQGAEELRAALERGPDELKKSGVLSKVATEDRDVWVISEKTIEVLRKIKPTEVKKEIELARNIFPRPLEMTDDVYRQFTEENAYLIVLGRKLRKVTGVNLDLEMLAKAGPQALERGWNGKITARTRLLQMRNYYELSDSFSPRMVSANTSVKGTGELAGSKVGGDMVGAGSGNGFFERAGLVPRRSDGEFGERKGLLLALKRAANGRTQVDIDLATRKNNFEAALKLTDPKGNPISASGDDLDAILSRKLTRRIEYGRTLNSEPISQFVRELTAQSKRPTDIRLSFIPQYFRKSIGGVRAAQIIPNEVRTALQSKAEGLEKALRAAFTELPPGSPLRTAADQTALLVEVEPLSASSGRLNLILEEGSQFKYPDRAEFYRKIEEILKKTMHEKQKDFDQFQPGLLKWDRDKFHSSS